MEAMKTERKGLLGPTINQGAYLGPIFSTKNLNIECSDIRQHLWIEKQGRYQVDFILYQNCEVLVCRQCGEQAERMK